MGGCMAKVFSLTKNGYAIYFILIFRWTFFVVAVWINLINLINTLSFFLAASSFQAATNADKWYFVQIIKNLNSEIFWAKKYISF